MERRDKVRFGAFTADLRSGELFKQGRKIKLQPKPFHILALLLKHPGEVVTRDELRQQVWSPDTFVDFDYSLKTAVGKIRQALGDSAEKPRFVETLARRGYRFIAAVEKLPEPVSPSPEATERVRLAVLPFENLSDDREQEYFSDGMTEEMIARLGRAQPQQLAVIARTSTMRYKRTDKGLEQIGQELKVDHVVEGSVLKAGDRVRITAQLVRVSDQTHLWAHSYERDLRDILALQSEVAQAISDAIQVKLAPEHWARNVNSLPANRQAHEAYLRGRYCWNRRTEEGIKKGMDYFQQAIELDPGYALAYAGLADCYTILAVYGLLRPSAAKVEAEGAAYKALEINDDLAEAHNSLGAVRFRFDWDWDQTETALQRAQTLNPSYADAHLSYALYLQAMGRLEESIAETGRACDLDPLSLLMETALGRALYFARQYDAAIAQCRKALELDGSYLPARFNLGRALVEKGRHQEAISELKQAANGGQVLYLAGLGNAYARAGDRQEARLLLAQLEKRTAQSYVSAYDLAKIQIGLGQKQRALEYLERAYSERSAGLVTVKVDPLFDTLHAESRFQGLLQRMRLEEAPPA